MKLIIAGGRKYDLTPEDTEKLDAIVGVTEVVSGGAPGVDSCGEQWASSIGLPIQVFKAETGRLMAVLLAQCGTG